MTPEEFKRICEAVEGYTALGLIDDAQNILEDLPSELKVTTEVITLHMGILLKSEEYLKASYLVETLSFATPDDVDRMLMVARYRYKAGAIIDAMSWLNAVEGKCKGDAYFHYLSAQCHAALGDKEAARASLDQVAAMNETLRMRALDDPALESIYGADQGAS